MSRGTPRASAEYVDGSRIRFHYPCGHSETIDYAKKRPAKRMGPEACRMMARWWGKDRGGVIATCRRCARAERKAGEKESGT